LIVLFVLAIAVPNYLVVGPPELHSKEFMPLEATELFITLWLVSMPIWLLTFLALALLRRVPWPLWVITAVALLVAVLGVAANLIIDAIIVMSV
jgi:hypothetical protein